MQRFGVELLVVALGAVPVLTMLISYILTFSNEHEGTGHAGEKYLPFISYLGSHPPERCVFTFGLNITAILGFSIVYLRYKHVRYLYSETIANVTCLNRFSAAVGFLSFFGVLVVASFQESTLKSVVHDIGAFMTFFFGTMYSWLQTLMSFKILRSQLSRHVGRCLLGFRLLLCVAASLSCLLCVSMTYHTAQEKHYVFHLLSTSSEWALASSFLLYFITFHPDLVAISLSIRIRTRHRNTSIIASSYGDEGTPLTL